MTRKRTSAQRAAAVDTVERALAAYAERGLFRGFGSRRTADGRLEVRFRWLTEVPCLVVVDPGAGTLTFRDLLPDVPYPSALDRELRRFVAERSQGSRPPHRRIDPERLRVRCSNRRGSVSLVATCVDGDWEQAVRKTISLVNEIFLGFLSGPWEEYMVATFSASQE